MLVQAINAFRREFDTRESKRIRRIRRVRVFSNKSGFWEATVEARPDRPVTCVAYLPGYNVGYRREFIRVELGSSNSYVNASTLPECRLIWGRRVTRVIRGQCKPGQRELNAKLSLAETTKE